MAQAVIKVENLHKSYQLDKNSTPIKVLHGISFEVNKGDFAILYGPSGSGKSTALHHTVGLETPTEGKVTVNNVEISALNNEDRAIFRAKNIGMVYQLFYWVKSLSVLENVALPLFISGYNQKEALDKAHYSLEQIGMAQYANKKPTQLSGGEQQRVGLARALVNNPEIVVADEPTGNLDTAAADKVMAFFQDLNHKQGRTVVMVTHNLAYLPMANKTVAMKDGLIVASGSSEGVKNQIKQELGGVQ